MIPNFLPFDHVPPTVDVAAKRRALGIPEGCPVIGTVTRLEPQKANEIFVRAVAHVMSKVPNLVTLIAGDGPQRKELEDLARSLGVGERASGLASGSRCGFTN